MRPHAIIVDIDGTLADCSHRVHHLASKPKDWDAFYAGCVNDTPIEHIIRILHNMANATNKRDRYNIIVATGRPERTRDTTHTWLQGNGVYPTKLFMRPDGDHRTDDALKREIYERDIAPYYDVLFVLEDRARVVKMWRSAGVPCLQVADGDF